VKQLNRVQDARQLLDNMMHGYAYEAFREKSAGTSDNPGKYVCDNTRERHNETVAGQCLHHFWTWKRASEFCRPTDSERARRIVEGDA